MLDVIVDHFAFGIGDGAFDGVKLLREFKAAFTGREHFNGRAQMSFGALQSLDDVRMAGVL